MARYKDLLQSGYSWDTVVVPLANVPHGLQKGTPEQRAQWERDGKPEPSKCGIRCLSPDEDVQVYVCAAAFAKERGVPEFVDTHPVCVKAVQHYTLALACVDLDSPDPCRPILFFGESIEDAAETLRKDPKRCITPDVVDYLFERYQIWKDKINPQALSLADMSVASLAEQAAEQADFLAYLRPGALITFTHSLAVQYVTLAAQTFGASTTSGSDTTKSSKRPASKVRAKPIKKAKRR
jgi:hypothetical protein